MSPIELRRSLAQNLNLCFRAPLDATESLVRSFGGMTSKSRLSGDVPDELPRELVELGKRIAGMPAGYQRDLEPIYNQVIDSVRRRRRILSLVQDALSQLRLDIKYLMFDLEVTRRERDALRDQLADD